MRLENKVALISGGAAGIGGATARTFVAEGAQVAITDIKEAEGQALAKELGKQAFFLRHDVTDEAQWQNAVAETVKRFGRLDILLNSAGVGVSSDFEETSLAEFRKVMAINSTGTFLGCKHAVPAMRKSGGGSIVNISSVLGLRGAGRTAAYAASKGSVRLLTKAIAVWAGKQATNIRCNSIHPGFIDTPMNQPRYSASMGENLTGKQWMESLHPIGRLGTPQEVANLILFLASDESSFCTGAEFVIDGGLTA